jgi:TPR repeat protein
MGVVGQFLGRGSPASALQRAKDLRDIGRAAEAFPLLARAAKAGIAEAEYGMAQCYFEGSGVPSNRPEAVRWLKAAAEHDYLDAQVLLSSFYLQGFANETNAVPASGSQIDQLFAGDEEPETSAPDFESAALWAQRAAEAGSAQAQALLGYILTNGPESLRDFDEAYRCYERSAAAGCAQGHLGYAISLMRQDKDPRKWRRVAEEMRRASDGGLPTATFLLAALAEAGAPGVEANAAAAAQLYRVAAERGQRSAQARWGLALMEGKGVEQDLAAGESWLRRAALAGDAQSAATVGDLYARGGPLPPNYAEAATWYRRAAEAGHAGAARALASLYLTGAGQTQDKDEAARWLPAAGEAASQGDWANLVAHGGGGAEDSAKVARWFAHSAVAGDLVGAFNIGMCLAKGVGVDRNDQEAARWLRNAAEGVPEAQYIYGRMLAEGRGMEPDLKAARTWFMRAAEAGLPEGEVALAEMMLNGRGGPSSTAEALKLFKKAAERGHSGAMFALGALCAGGHGLPIDRGAAQRWFRGAADHGHGHAQMMLGRYLMSGAAGDLDPAEGRKWLERAAAQGIAEAEQDLAAAPAMAAS